MSKEISFGVVKMDFVKPDDGSKKASDGNINESTENLINEYIKLVAKLSKPLHMIDEILDEYYEKNPNFPRGKADIMKWNVLRKANDSLVEVYFGEPKKEKKYADELAVGTATSAPTPAPSILPTPSIQVLTYALIGAPPTGPGGNPGHP